MTMGLKEWALLIGLSMIWGGSFFFNEIALRELSPMMLVWLRVSIAAIALWAVVIFNKLPLPAQPTFWLAMLLMGLVNNVVPFTLIVWGQQTISSGLASIMNATTPLFTVLVAGLILPDERFSLLRVVGVVTGLGGVTVMIGTDHLANSLDTVLAQLAVLGAAFCYAISGTFGRRVNLTSNAPIIAAAAQVSAASLWLLPAALWREDMSPLFHLSMPTLGAIVTLGVVCTALAYIIYFSILRSSGATNISLVTFLVPVSAIWLGWAFLGESLKLVHYIGMLCIAAGLAAIDGRPIRWVRRRLRLTEV